MLTYVPFSLMASYSVTLDKCSCICYYSISNQGQGFLLYNPSVHEVYSRN